MNNEQLMKLDGLVYLREITSGNFENVSEFIEYITTDETEMLIQKEKLMKRKFVLQKEIIRYLHWRLPENLRKRIKFARNTAAIMW